jgi:hypothetical protein
MRPNTQRSGVGSFLLLAVHTNEQYKGRYIACSLGSLGVCTPQPSFAADPHGTKRTTRHACV